LINRQTKPIAGTGETTLRKEYTQKRGKVIKIDEVEIDIFKEIHKVLRHYASFPAICAKRDQSATQRLVLAALALPKWHGYDPHLYFPY
jgi:hypothetical protein